MSTLGRLRNAKTLIDFASIIGLEPRALSYILYIQTDIQKYKEFDIPKKSGGVRRIAAPQDRLKLVQRRLATLLQDCLDEIDGVVSEKKQISHGFKRKLSIYTNAKKHRKKRYVFNVDLIDFFGSINFGRVRGFFYKR